jgi:glycosyltransferase involved in cell wall biosynthesis
MKIKHSKTIFPHVVICSPIFWGGGSGASSYYQLLAKEFVLSGFQVSVISDQEVLDGGLNVNYFSLFPARCSRNRRVLRDHFAYLLENMAYFRIERLIRNIRPRCMILHSSFYNHPGLFPWLMQRLMRRLPDIDFIADVRDTLMPLRKVPLLNNFHRVFACSENVSEHLLAGGLVPEKIVRVPVIQERLRVDEGVAKLRLLKDLELHGRVYIFYAGLVKEGKAIELLLKAFLQYVRPARAEVLLVIAGLMKTSARSVQNMLEEDGVMYVGNRSREDVLALASSAALCVNLSPKEGMPRSSLEPLALGRPAVLPPNVPEFTRHCGDFVVAERSPEIVAARMLEIMDAGVGPNYPIDLHYPEKVLPIYLEAILNAHSYR